MIFFSRWRAPKSLRNFEKLSNMAKNEENPCSTVNLLATHFPADSKNSNIGFRVPQSATSKKLSKTVIAKNFREMGKVFKFAIPDPV